MWHVAAGSPAAVARAVLRVSGLRLRARHEGPEAAALARRKELAHRDLGRRPPQRYRPGVQQPEGPLGAPAPARHRGGRSDGVVGGLPEAH
eukprot:4549628-Alexandrium_andersonii.AAC.1